MSVHAVHTHTAYGATGAALGAVFGPILTHADAGTFLDIAVRAVVFASFTALLNYTVGRFMTRSVREAAAASHLVSTAQARVAEEQVRTSVEVKSAAQTVKATYEQIEDRIARHEEDELEKFEDIGSDIRSLRTGQDRIDTQHQEFHRLLRETNLRLEGLERRRTEQERIAHELGSQS